MTIAEIERAVGGTGRKKVLADAARNVTKTYSDSPDC